MEQNQPLRNRDHNNIAALAGAIHWSAANALPKSKGGEEWRAPLFPVLAG
jgi:hypothetical protein